MTLEFGNEDDHETETYGHETSNDDHARPALRRRRA
jgi:hypothetical protein